MLRMRLAWAHCCASSFTKSNCRHNPRRRSSSSSSPSSSDGGGESSGDGGEGARGRRRGCLAATVGRPLGVDTVEVVVLVPAPARRRAVRGRVGAVVVVAVVTGRVRVDVTGWVVGRVRVDVVGRLGGAVVMGAMVVVCSGGGAVVVMGGAVRVPATGGRLNIVRASSTFDGVGQVKMLNLLVQLGSIDRLGQLGHHVGHAAEIQGGRWCRGGDHASG